MACDNWKHTSTASISYDGMTSHRDVMTRRCVMLAAALELIDWLKVLRVWPWPLTSRGHPRYLTSEVRYSISKFSEFDLDLRLLEVTWGQKYLYNLKAYTLTFLSNFYWHFLSLSLSLSLSYRFETFDLKVFEVWPFTFREHLGLKIFQHSNAQTWLSIQRLLLSHAMALLCQSSQPLP